MSHKVSNLCRNTLARSRRRPQNEDDLKNEDENKNEDDLKNEEDLKNEDDLKN